MTVWFVGMFIWVRELFVLLLNAGTLQTRSLQPTGESVQPIPRSLQRTGESVQQTGESPTKQSKCPTKSKKRPTNPRNCPTNYIKIEGKSDTSANVWFFMLNKMCKLFVFVSSAGAFQTPTKPTHF